MRRVLVNEGVLPIPTGTRPRVPDILNLSLGLRHLSRTIPIEGSFEGSFNDVNDMNLRPETMVSQRPIRPPVLGRIAHAIDADISGYGVGMAAPALRAIPLDQFISLAIESLINAASRGLGLKPAYRPGHSLQQAGRRHESRREPLDLGVVEHHAPRFIT